MTTPVEAVLLDLDGTLILSEQAHRQTWYRFFDSWGIEVSDDEYRRNYMGRRARDILGQVPGPWSGTDITGLLQTLTEHDLALAHTVTAVPGAAALVRLLHDLGRPVGVVTSAGTGWAHQVLADTLGVYDLVTTLVTAEDIDNGKPSPEGYLRACELLDLPPAACAGIEDSPSGIRALVSAGVGDIVGISTTSSATELRTAGAHRTVPDLRLDGQLRHER